MKNYNVSTNLIIILIVYISLCFQLNMFAQNKRVSLKNEREDILVSVDLILNPTNPELMTRFENVWNPFEPDIKPTVQSDSGPAATIQPNQINEKLILMQVVRRLNPKGSLILGKTRILILEDRGKLHEGDIISTRIGESTYKVQITEITGRYFSLSLNQTKLTSSFSKASSKGRVTLNKTSN